VRRKAAEEYLDSSLPIRKDLSCVCSNDNHDYLRFRHPNSRAWLWEQRTRHPLRAGLSIAIAVDSAVETTALAASSLLDCCPDRRPGLSPQLAVEDLRMFTATNKTLFSPL